MRFTIILSLLFLINCGGSDKKDQLQSNRFNNQINQINPNAAQTQTQSQIIATLDRDVTEELSFMIKASGLSMSHLHDGRTLFMQCERFELFDELRNCYLDYDQRGLFEQRHQLGAGRSQDLLYLLNDEKLSDIFFSEEIFNLQCAENCSISTGNTSTRRGSQNLSQTTQGQSNGF